VDSTRIHRFPAHAALALCLWHAGHAAACWEEAAARYQVNSAVLVAIARTESGMNPRAVGQNRNGTRDLGLMQINSAWLPALATHGISEHDLFDACTSIHVGAWVLAQNIHRLGYTWEAVGAYNAATPSLRKTYIDKVKRNLVVPAAALRSTP
jgi:soluble lytic murein transglycosylase-like protein